MEKTNLGENIRKIKKHLKKGDFLIIRKRILEKYDMNLSRSTIASTLNPNSEYIHEIVYAEALELSVERKKTFSKTRKKLTTLEAQL